jgi:hypothetical protein
MQKVVILTLEQKESLVGQQIQPDWYFNPVLDCNENWIVTEPEIYESTNPTFDWLKSLPLIDWCGHYIPSETANYYDQFFKK